MAAALPAAFAVPAAGAVAARGAPIYATAAQPVTLVPASIPQPGSAALTLINGDRVVAGPAGQSAVHVSGNGLATSLMTMHEGTTTLLIPVAAFPFIGHGMDASLFSTTALAKAEHGGRLRLMLHYQGSTPPKLPGVIITHSGPGNARGYLTAASAPRFGAALARQFAADHARGRYGTDGLFAHGLVLSLRGAPSPAPVRPAFPMHKLTMTGTTSAGQPDTGDIVHVFNVTNPHAMADFGSASVFYRGTAKFSVPSGTYWAWTGFFSGTPNSYTFKLVVLPQFTVSGDKTVPISEKTAVSKLSFVTPRPAINVGDRFIIIRGVPGALIAYQWILDSHGSLWINPSRTHHTVGTLKAYTIGQLISPPRAPQYAYTLNFASPDGTIPSLRHVTRPSQLATIHETYYQDRPSMGSFLTEGGTPLEMRLALPGGYSLPLHLPGRQVQYVSASPPQYWQTAYSEYSRTRGGQDGGGQYENTQFWRVNPGQRLTEQWNRHPLHPGWATFVPGMTNPFSGPYLWAAAGRIGNQLLLNYMPFTDNEPGHSSSSLAGQFVLRQNGVIIAHGKNTPSSISAKLSPKPATLRLAITATRSGPRFPLSATSKDVWTWRTRPEPSARVSGPWYCGWTRANHKNRKCAAQPLLALRYQLGHLALNGTVPAGRQSLDVLARHIQPARGLRITKASVEVSFNKGRSWHRVILRHRHGAAYAAKYSAPVLHTFSLRVTVCDAGGSTLTETILKLSYGASGGPAAQLIGWPGNVTNLYRYLATLPAQPAALRKFILVNNRSQPSAAFDAVAGLMNEFPLPQRFQAELYAVLVGLPGVHFDRSATDAAGRRGIALYMIQGGFLKKEIIVNPRTYIYMGVLWVAVKAHTEHGTNPAVLRLHKGSIVGWNAIISSGIVSRAGQLP